MFKKIKLSKTSSAVLFLFAISILIPTGILIWWRKQPHSSLPTMAIMGDSISDEYRADDNRGSTYSSTTKNWVEQLAATNQLSFGAYRNWGGFRRTGYAYNFSRSGATTESFLASDAPSELDSLISSGRIDYLFYQLGENDLAWYNQEFRDIFDGKIQPTAQTRLVDRMFSSIDHVDPSHRTRVIIATIPDWTENQLAKAQFSNPTGRDKVRRALVRTNEEIRRRAKEKGYAILDVESFEMSLRNKADASGNVRVGRTSLSFSQCSDEPSHAVLADCVHYGTLLSTLYANELITTINQTYHTTFQSLQIQ